jgi:hypothetical protein
MGELRAAHSTLQSRFFEIALVLVRFDHVASVIVNANHRIYVSGCDATELTAIGRNDGSAASI